VVEVRGIDCDKAPDDMKTADVTTGKIRILIADGHPICRDGLRTLLQAQDDVVVVGEATDGAEAVLLAGELKPDVMVLDPATRKRTGLEVLDDLGRTGSLVKTVLLTAGMNRTEEIRCLQLGARGIVLKENPAHLLLKGIRTVATGGYWVGRETVSDLVEALARLDAVQEKPTRRDSLTPRQMEILALVVKGYTNKDIARACAIGEDTVKHHLTNIFDRTGASNRLELAMFAINHRLVQDA
jgi:two-component system nitrate/nitrite response regulator NarL